MWTLQQSNMEILPKFDEKPRVGVFLRQASDLRNIMNVREDSQTLDRGIR